MRVIKQNTLRYEAFYKSLPYLTGTGDSDKNISLNYGSRLSADNTPVTTQLNKYKTLFENLSAFQGRINNFEESDVQGMIMELEDAVKRIIPCRDVNLFHIEDSKFVSVSKSAPEYSVNFINNAYKEGILDWVFEDSYPKVIPDLKLYSIKGSKLNYIFFPLKSEKKNKGILSILSTITALPRDSVESKIIQLIGTIVFSKIELIKKTNELKSAYQDQQIYQSKLLNDYKLSAIGELTNGVVEEILSPLQVIMSQVDFLRKENSEVTETEADTIKTQVKKVERIITRLVKFASINNDNIKIYPCDLNRLIKDYYNLLSSTLKNINYESYLDLADNLPPVLSNPDYIYQILANVFSLINAPTSDENGGGVLIQTRYKDKKINVRIVFTNQLKNINNENDAGYYSLRIVDNLMKKHEGELQLLGNEINGSVIVLTFPLQRKIKL